MDLGQTMYQNCDLDENMRGKTIRKFCKLDLFFSCKTEKICENLTKFHEDCLQA